MLHVAESGSGTPLVLLHAYPCDHTMWDPQASALAERGIRVIRPDLPGFGSSPPPTEAEPSLRVMADSVFEALDARGVDRFVLGGLSMGGYVAMQMLRQQPDRITGLALVDTKATPDGDQARAVREETARKALAAGSLVPLTEGMLLGLLGATSRASRPEAQRVTEDFIARASAPAAAWAMRAMAVRPDSLPILGTYDRPAVVIAGDEDSLSPLDEQHLMVNALPSARLVTIPGCGHLSAVEQPQAVTTALQEYLDQL